MSENIPVTVVETPEFLSATRKLMTEEERAALVDYLAYNPVGGDLFREQVGCASSVGGSRAAESAAAPVLSISITAPCLR
jgi:hypothetical protein